MLDQVWTLLAAMLTWSQRLLRLRLLRRLIERLPAPPKTLFHHYLSRMRQRTRFRAGLSSM